jgi:hypothetical protein
MAGNAMGNAQPDLTGQILQGLQDAMAAAPAPWPDAWRREYMAVIREAIVSHEDDPQYAVRLEILYNGFGPWWEGLDKRSHRSLFEVHCAQIRWYVEHLMATQLPSEEGKQALRDQYRNLSDHTVDSLLAQFPFLDAERVKQAKADHLVECYRNVEAPLLPIFLLPLSEAQVSQIKQRWHDLRYARVDLWRQLGGKAASSENRDTSSSEAHPHYLLTQRSLAQLRPHIWALVAPAPDYYRRTVDNELDTLKRRFRSTVEAGNEERRLAREILQTEYISFLLGALLETPDCFEGKGTMSRAEQE